MGRALVRGAEEQPLLPARPQRHVSPVHCVVMFSVVMFTVTRLLPSSISLTPRRGQVHHHQHAHWRYTGTRGRCNRAGQEHPLLQRHELHQVPRVAVVWHVILVYIK